MLRVCVLCVPCADAHAHPLLTLHEGLSLTTVFPVAQGCLAACVHYHIHEGLPLTTVCQMAHGCMRACVHYQVPSCMVQPSVFLRAALEGDSSRVSASE